MSNFVLTAYNITDQGRSGDDEPNFGVMETDT